MSMEENKAIVRRFLDALDRQDFDALKEHPGLYATVVRQPIIRAAFPDLQTTIEHQVAEGDTVATRATLRGTHLGTLFGVAPTNQTLTWSVLLMDKITDGKNRSAPCERGLDRRARETGCDRSTGWRDS